MKGLLCNTPSSLFLVALLGCKIFTLLKIMAYIFFCIFYFIFYKNDDHPPPQLAFHNACNLLQNHQHLQLNRQCDSTHELNTMVSLSAV